MDINQKQFDKAQSFFLETLSDSQEKHGKTKEALRKTIEVIEKEFRNAKNIDYQRSLMALTGEMNRTINEMNKDN